LACAPLQINIKKIKGKNDVKSMQMRFKEEKKKSMSNMKPKN
jgi:hypothetical protein